MTISISYMKINAKISIHSFMKTSNVPYKPKIMVQIVLR